MAIGERIRQYRKKMGMSQRELGEKLGVSQQHIAQYENGKRYPKIETIINIASALKCSVSELEDRHLDVNINYAKDKKPIIQNGVISPDITDISKMLEEINELPFTVMTEGEKLIVYYNSLNELGKEKAIDYMETLLSSSKYRNNLPTVDKL